MQIKSDVFINGGELPSKYTCDGVGVVPPLKFAQVPFGAKSLVLMVEDPDAPKSSFAPDGLWVHWLVWNIDPTKSLITEGEDKIGIVGTNSSKKAKYDIPCPPSGEHRYIFKLFALDIVLDLLAGSNRDELLTAMKGHVLESAEMFGRYSR